MQRVAQSSAEAHPPLLSGLKIRLANNRTFDYPYIIVNCSMQSNLIDLVIEKRLKWGLLNRAEIGPLP
jgi:hypothetical protein